DLTETWIFEATGVAVAGQYDNIGTAEGTPPAGEAVNDSDESSYFGSDPAIQIVKTGTFDAGEDGVANVGELITYTFTVTNVGNITLTEVTVTDPLMGLGPITYVSGDANEDGKLQLSEIWSYAATYAVTQVDIDAGSVENLATADSKESGPDDDPETVTLPQSPAIQVVKTSDAPDGIVERGALVTYTYVVTNIGDVDLFNVVVTDDKLGVVGTLEMLAVGASETLTASANLNDTTTNVVVATGEDKNGEEVSDDDTLTVETFVPFTQVDLAIEKFVSGTTFKPGNVITYTLHYQNLGTRPASDFTIVDDFDERYVSVLDANGGLVADGKITWIIAGPLSADDGVKSLAYTVRVKADMPTGTTKVGNIVVISHPDDYDLTNNRGEATITVKEEPFLPFTGGDAMLLLLVAFLSAVAGLFLRRRTA
ncbi:MAG TPA: hypothetical protein VFE45_00050, partial [Coriobacteriia bacterium]|nr:hypothetical protein [Coriobacteriia bacterium]